MVSRSLSDQGRCVGGSSIAFVGSRVRAGRLLRLGHLRGAIEDSVAKLGELVDELLGELQLSGCACRGQETLELLEKCADEGRLTPNPEHLTGGWEARY